MGVLGIIGKLVLAVAVTIGAIGKLQPTLFLRLPMGFIPWAMTGNPMPPYFDPTPFAEGEFETWIKSGDLLVSAGAKSGTNWMLYCAHQIRTRAAGDTATDFTDILIDTPWVGMNQKPGQTWADIKVLMNTTVLADGSLVKDHWDAPSHPFRIFKSHYGPSVLPITKHPKVKFLGMSRNGMDVVASFFPFFAGHTPEFKKSWGGFPPTYATPMDCLKDLLPSGILADIYFGYVKDWWSVRNEPNVLLLHYADAKKDLGKVVSQLAEFVGVSLSNAEHAEVTRRCGIDHMRTVTEKFDYKLWAGSGKTIMCGEKRCPGVEGSIIRTGKVGGGEQFFTEEMKALWDEAVENEFADPAMKEWAANGGAFP